MHTVRGATASSFWSESKVPEAILAKNAFSTYLQYYGIEELSEGIPALKGADT